ncbi:pyridoxal phosphate-dependent transferase [Epithele typhae]|uniref:pyridoxal phosphate-dependent transferase n=1 Tax=Epithele typhae TaxID=378194 RepID=UPI002007A178|nr:pyridoxal phosphate-dependent transferase [Epithele typhae]KAH9929020.1 pyridoxal phosphate-dependent transferase [Epithele typhae]
MDIEAFRKAGYQAIDRICDYFESLHSRPVVAQVDPGFLIDALPENAPEEGEDFSAIADDFQKLILPGITNWQHPNFFAFFPTANTFESVLGDLYSSSVSNPGFSWLASPACTELEQVVMDWTARLLGLSPHFLCASGTGGGAIQNSASEAFIVAAVAARARYMRENPNARMEELVLYTTTQTHSLGAKAGLVLGLEVRDLQVRAEDGFALRGAMVREAVEEDIARGKRPFLVVGTVGTTNTGAVDHVDEIGQVLKDYPSIWLHVDAAWAGICFVCPEYREQGQLAAINEYANSFCTNFHKWGLVNFDATALWVRQRHDLIDALDVTPAFLRTKQYDAGSAVDYRNWHLGLGRRFRSLKVWFVLRSYGVAGFRAHIRKGVALNDHFVALVRAAPEFEFAAAPVLALSVIRLKDPAGASAEAADALNRAFAARVAAANGRVFLTQSTLAGRTVLRFAIGAERTEVAHIEGAFEVIRGCAAEALKEFEAGGAEA